MSVKIKKVFNYKIIFIFLFLIILFSLKIKCDATYTITTDSTPFAYSPTGGMVVKVYIPGHGWRLIWCVERGKPFRSQVSELQMLYATTSDYHGNEVSGLIPEIFRDLSSASAGNDVSNWKFRGWGIWSLNSDHTDAVQVSNLSAPSSLAWQEAFDEDGEDTEDPNYEEMIANTNLRYGTEAGVYTYHLDWYFDIANKITGHEGCKEVFTTSVKPITFADAGFSESQRKAFAILNYYIFDDPDASEFDEYTKWRVEQILSWAIQFGFIDTSGMVGSDLRLIYQNSTGFTRSTTGSFNYSGSCDCYVKLTIGNNYQDLKLYRQVVWKTTNMRIIPSFASRNPNTSEPIKLYWDASIGKYTATVADANGVLDYFDFNVPGCTVSKNGDGTLTITADGQVNSTSSPSQSGLEPTDGVFKLPDFYRWSLEGTQKTLSYTMLTSHLDGENGGAIVDDMFGGYYFPTIWIEDGSGRETEETYKYVHSHNYQPACNWFCGNKIAVIQANHMAFAAVAASDATNTEYWNSCVPTNNAGWEDGHNTYHEHNDSCGSEEDGYPDCGGGNNAGWVNGHFTRHEHTTECHDCHESKKCQHQWTCPYYIYERAVGYQTYINAPKSDYCTVVWCCGKGHFKTKPQFITGTFINWQDFQGTYLTGQQLIDPIKCYIRVETVPHEYPAETDTEILLIADNDEWNDLTYVTANGKTIRHSSHLRVGEKFHLKYIYSYKGASKGFRIESSTQNKSYYQYNYLSRMESPWYEQLIYQLRSGLAGDRFAYGSIGVPHAVLVQDLTNIKIKGLYNTPETAYTLNGTYSWESGDRWNDKVYLDALVTDQYDDNYNNKSASSITSNSGASELTDFSVTKPSDNNMIVVWEFDTEPEVFSSAMVYGTSFIEVGSNQNYTRSYFDEAYNYAKDGTWGYSLEEHNQVGGVGYFSSGQSGESVPRHAVYTQNNESKTHAIRNKVWQSDVDIKVSKFVQNTGAGITEQIYQERGRNTHDMNYNLYYTIEVENPQATIFADKQRYANHSDLPGEQTTAPYDTRSDVYEFDVNNLISWGSTGASQTGASYGTTTVVDHIKTGTTYIQREIPTVLATMTSSPKETMTFSIYPNHDRLVYEDYYTNATIEGTGLNRKVKATAKDTLYPTNKKTAVSDIWPAMNPNYVEMQPQNITGSNNVPDKNNQGDNVLHHTGMTSFSIELSNGQTKTVTDGNVKNYTQYDFEYNPTNRNNKVTFPSYRRSIMFFKYSKTNYSYNGSNVQSAIGEFRGNAKTQKESYYISQVLFKSNYTTKYMKELEHQGADYIKDYDSRGNMTDAWIDMVNQNKFAIVSAGQGFELRVTLKYENSYLTQYLSRYFGLDDGQHDALGTSNRIKQAYLPSATETNRQFANISALTGKDGRSTPYYKDTERAYISGNSILDRLAVNLVTGSNVFNDLYVFMSDNPDTVYSYSGIYDTPVIFNRSIKYSEDFSVTTVTYTMCVSHENGIASNLQNMKFYTNQLAPDKRTPGIVEGTRDVSDSGEHSITIWTPIIAATPVTYPNLEQENWNASTERYIGDAIELGYTIKTTGADDAIVHIVQ